MEILKKISHCVTFPIIEASSKLLILIKGHFYQMLIRSCGITMPYGKLCINGIKKELYMLQGLRKHETMLFAFIFWMK